MNYWLVRADWSFHNGALGLETLIQNNIWENGYDDKFYTQVNSINIGDTLLLAVKSQIKYIAQCSRNPHNGKIIEVDHWQFLDKAINIPKGYSRNITRVKNEKILLNILTQLSTRKLSSALYKTVSSYNKDSIYLDAIEINNYFSIEKIEIKDLKDKKEIYFVGENGDGKTILLQAIALALKTKYSGQTIEYIEPLLSEDKFKILTKDDSEDTQYIEKKDIKNIFAYGINRNKIHPKDYDGYGFSGLFDTSDARKTTYLKDPLTVLESDNTLVNEFMNQLNSEILKDNIKIVKDNKNKINLYENGFPIDFEKLSEGYKSTIIWLCDLVSRLIENQKDLDIKVDVLENFKAIVIIDEVDLYLHPKWKYDFIDSVRKVFKNIQFIMTTHSMVTVLGARADAVFYKVYKDENITKISHPMQNIHNQMANTLSTSPLFGMSTARARNSNEDIDTSQDYLYAKIHKKIAQKVKGKKAIIEDEILDMIDKELLDFEKEST